MIINPPAKSASLLRAAHFAEDRSQVEDALKRLTLLTAHSPNVFSSPLGPFAHRREIFLLPRQLFFGEFNAEEIWRIGIYAGLSGTDTCAMLVSAKALELLILQPSLGRDFQLVLHPNVNPSGLADGTSRTRGGHDLSASSWSNADAPELQLLERDAIAQQYHGFIIIRSDPTINELHGWLRGFSPEEPFLQSQPLLGFEKTGYLPFQFPITWEPHPDGRAAQTGPLSLAEDMRMRPFEITLRLPGDLDNEGATQALGHTLRVLLNNFRTAVSSGLNL